MYEPNSPSKGEPPFDRSGGVRSPARAFPAVFPCEYVGRALLL